MLRMLPLLEEVFEVNGFIEAAVTLYFTWVITIPINIKTLNGNLRAGIRERDEKARLKVTDA